MAEAIHYNHSSCNNNNNKRQRRRRVVVQREVTSPRIRSCLSIIWIAAALVIDPVQCQRQPQLKQQLQPESAANTLFIGDVFFETISPTRLSTEEATSEEAAAAVTTTTTTTTIAGNESTNTIAEPIAEAISIAGSYSNPLQPSSQEVTIEEDVSSRRNGSVLPSGRMYTDRLSCASNIRRIPTMSYQARYTVGVYAPSTTSARQDYGPLFAEYLTATVGNRFHPPIEFQMVPFSNVQQMDQAMDEQTIDFVYVDPGMFSCITVERGAQALVTAISRGEVRGSTFHLDVSGGVIFTKSSNQRIHTMKDLKDKVLAASTVSSTLSGQVQFFEMARAGLSYVMDPKQVVFTSSEHHIVQGVLDGTFDVGFVRTGTIERTQKQNGDLVNPDEFKVIQPRIYVLDDGQLFPFLHSTDIFPEWPVAVMKHVSLLVAEEVQEALIALSEHSQAMEDLIQCVDECDISRFATRCETTLELAILAKEAREKAKVAGFHNPKSYFGIRTMQESGNFLAKDLKGNWYCPRAQTLYDGITCPVDHYKVTENEFKHSCAVAGLTCDGYECFCKPCVKAFEVDVFQYTHSNDDNNTTTTAMEEFVFNVANSLAKKTISGCAKMSLCGSVQQTKTAIFRAIDNKKRDDVQVTAIMHIGRNTNSLQVRKVPNEPYTYEFSWSVDHLGVAIIEVYFDGEQISESPIRVQVVSRACEEDYPGQYKTPNEIGICLCKEGSFKFNDICISSTIVAVVVSVIVIIIISQVMYVCQKMKNKKNDQLWNIGVEELDFDDPVQVIGQGSFGVVLLAEYRGTKVAIKRALKRPHNNRSGSKHGSKSSRAGGSQGPSNKNNKNKIGEDSVSLDDTPESEDYPLRGEGMGTSVHLESVQEETGANQSLGFLGSEFGFGGRGGGILGWLNPWKRREDYQSRFKESLLGDSTSAAVTHSGFASKIFPWCDSSHKLREEFVSEMRLLSRLRHPCITTVMGAVMAENRDPMLVMEYMEFGSLHALLRKEATMLSGDVILQILRDIAQGVRYLHSSKPVILHGDLKARNILIDARFRAKVCDFGLASKTKGMVTGTPYWLAPEYLRGETSYNTSCDMYSIGIIIFEIYSKKNPYEGENFREVLRKVCDRRVNKRPGFPGPCPSKMAELMKKCWSPDPSSRPKAKDLDTMVMDMNSQDVEPLSQFEQEDVTKDKPTDMLYELFPKYIANALKAGQKVDPEDHELVTVVFSDIVKFTDISRTISPMKVSNMLDRLYQQFDRIARKHDVFKVETIGDAYMGVTNLEANQNDTHVKHIAEFAIDMIHEANKILIDEENPDKGYIRIRVGFHSGPVVTDVIGSLNPRYGLFGDTVNTASRMESNSKGNRILCSERSYHLLKEQAPEMPVRKRGKIFVKGKGDMNVYWVGVGAVKGCQRLSNAGRHVSYEIEDSSDSEEEEEPAQMETTSKVEVSTLVGGDFD